MAAVGWDAELGGVAARGVKECRQLGCVLSVRESRAVTKVWGSIFGINERIPGKRKAGEKSLWGVKGRVLVELRRGGVRVVVKAGVGGFWVHDGRG